MPGLKDKDGTTKGHKGTLSCDGDLITTAICYNTVNIWQDLSYSCFILFYLIVALFYCNYVNYNSTRPI